MNHSFFVSLGALLLGCGFPQITAADSVVERFEAQAAPSGASSWSFWNGSEYPGASGSFQFLTSAGVGTGYGKLTANFSNGGEYVIAEKSFSPALPQTLLGLKMALKVTPGMVSFLRVHDSTGQTLQYACTRPVESSLLDRYYTSTLMFSEAPQYFWGGANSGKLAGNITSVGVGLMPLKFPDSKGVFKLSETVGTLVIDSITTITSSALTITGKEPVLPSPLGSSAAYSVGVAIHFTDNPAALDAAVAAGAKCVRMDLLWSEVEKVKGRFDFSRWDILVRSAAVRGLKVLLILDYGNPLYSGYGPNGSDKNPPVTDAARKAFSTFAEMSARHFRAQGVSYELWNEPNLSMFWSPVDPYAYARLIKDAAAGVKRGDPAAVIASGGLSQTDFPYLKAMLSTGSFDSLSAISVHPYDWSSPELQMDMLVYVRELVRQRGGIPQGLWITECGVSSACFGDGRTLVNQKKQASLVLRQVLMHWGIGSKLDVMYDLFDDGSDRFEKEHNFGLYSQSLSPKPAANAMIYLRKATAGKTLEGFLQLADSRAHALSLKATTGRLLVIWSTAKPAKIVIPAGATVANMYGQAVSPAAGWTLTASEEPLFVTVP